MKLPASPDDVANVLAVSASIPNRRSSIENPLVPLALSSATQNPKFKIQNAYGRLPLRFEANQGQTDARVRFLARGSGYTIFLTADEAVLSLQTSHPGMNRLGKFDLSRQIEPFGPIDPSVGRWPGLADHLKFPSLISNLGRCIPTPNAGEGGVAVGLESQSPQVIRMKVVGGNGKARIVGLDELPGRSNYFIGNNPKMWRTNVPSYARVKYEDVYPGVDLVYYGNQRQLEYDFVVAPGADPTQIKLSFAGTVGTRIDGASGDLVVKVGEKEVRFHKPTVSQPAVTAPLSWPSPYLASASGHDACRSKLIIRHSSFLLAGNNEVAFRVAGYDPKHALMIDPVLSYSTYLGGSGYDAGQGIAVDASGNAYVTGYTASSDFPIGNPVQRGLGGGMADVFVTKLTTAGSALIYSSYLGGNAGDWGMGIAVDSSGNAYVTGKTTSIDFPTANAFQASKKATPTAGTTAFVVKLNSTGSALVYSTYLGGSGQDWGYGIAVDSSGNAYVTGDTESTDFPTAVPLQAINKATPKTENATAFVGKLNSTGSALVYSTYLGGSEGDAGRGIALDSSGNAYVTGYTFSTDFPTVNPLQASDRGDFDAFVAKLNAAGSALVYSTYLGGSTVDYGYGIAVDSSGNAYVTGRTYSTDFPTAHPLQPSNAGDGDGFVTKLNAAGSALVYSTYLGGSRQEEGNSIAVDSSGNAYVTGWTFSTDFPSANLSQAACGGCSSYSDAFVTKLNRAGSALVYSIYLGGSSFEYGYGIAVDSAGNAYVAGETSSTDFPTVNPLQTINRGGFDAFVTRISAGSVAGLSEK